MLLNVYMESGYNYVKDQAEMHPLVVVLSKSETLAKVVEQVGFCYPNFDFRLCYQRTTMIPLPAWSNSRLMLMCSLLQLFAFRSARRGSYRRTSCDCGTTPTLHGTAFFKTWICNFMLFHSMRGRTSSSKSKRRTDPGILRRTRPTLMRPAQWTFLTELALQKTRAPH